MSIAEKIQKWYEKNGRDLPWRVKGGAHPSAYRVWISEIMLQQTTVATVLPYFDRFLKRFPTVEALAAAPLADVLLLWQGLGYYTRARKLHECARTLVERHGGRFPADRKALRTLPGIGDYTSASIAAFAFNLPEPVVDGNVIRVLTRLNGRDEPVASIGNEINDAAAALMKSAPCPADHASAMMDLGATVCTPKSPKCLLCPLQSDCRAFRDGTTDKIPNISKPKRDKRKGFAFAVKNAAGALMIRKRTEKGLLHGLYELPWNTDESLPFDADWRKTDIAVRHVFTHFDLTLEIVRLTTETPFADGFFVRREDLENYPFSTMMKKVLKASL